MSEDASTPTGRAESGRATARIGVEPYHTNIELPGDHHLVADAPEFAGGANHGPAAIDLLVAALAASKAAMLRQQADRHGWPMTGATINACHRRVPARSIGAGSRGTIDLVECEIAIAGDELTDQQRRRLCELSDHCWVQHALRHEAQVNCRLVDRRGV
jgi:putative redox protein